MKTFRKFTGLRNTVPPEKFDGADLAVAENVDLSAEGQISGRAGFSVLSATASRGLWSNGERAFYAQGTTLYELNKDLTSTAIQTGVTGTRLSYADVADTIYWSDGKQAGVIKGRTATAWGVPPPNPCTVTLTAGDLPAGTYLVSAVARRADGIESGAAIFTAVAVAANQGLQITTGGYSYEADIYVSQPNGTVPQFVGTVTPGLPNLTLFGLPMSARTLTAMQCGPAPAGSRVFFFAGCMWVVSGNFLFHSRPFELELFDLANGFFGFESAIRTAAPVNDGIFVGTDDKTYFLAGANPSEMQLIDRTNYGTVEGTEYVVRNDKVGEEGVAGKTVMWMSRRGVCLGVDGGEMKNLTSDRHIPSSALVGASLFKIKDGTPQFLVSTFN